MVDKPQFWAPGTPLSGMAFAGSRLRGVVIQSESATRSQAWRYGIASCLIQVTVLIEILIDFLCIPFADGFCGRVPCLGQAVDPSMLNE